MVLGLVICFLRHSSRVLLSLYSSCHCAFSTFCDHPDQFHLSLISRPSPVCFPVFFAVILVPFVFWIAFVYLVLAFSYCAYYMVALHKLRLRCPH